MNNNKKIEEIEKKIEELKEKVKELKSKKWKPIKNECYFWYCDEFEVINTAFWHDNENDNRFYEKGIVFKTEAEAQKYANYKKAKKEYAHEFTEEEWKNVNIEKFFIYVDSNGNLICDRALTCRIVGVTYFESDEKTEKFINKYEKEILKYEFNIEND